MKNSGPSPLRQTIESSLLVLLAESLVLPTGFLVTIILTRWLGPARYGLFTLAASLVVWVQWTAVSFFSRATVKFVGEAADWRPIAGAVLRLQLVFAIIALLLLWLLAEPISILFGETVLADYLRLFALEVPFFCLFFAQQQILVGLGRFRERAWTSAARWISRLLFILLFVGLGLSVSGAIVGTVAASLFAFLLAWFFLRLPFYGSASSAAAGIWVYALPLFFSALSLRLYERLDLFALKALGATASQAGVYGAAQSLAWIPGLFALSFSPLIISTLSRLLRIREMALAREIAVHSLRIVFWLLPFAALAAGSSSEIVLLIFGSNFSGAATIFPLLIFAAVALVIISITTALFTASGKPTWALALTLPLLPLALIGHITVIPRWGSMGAALVTMAFALAGAAASLLAASRAWQIALPYPTLVRSLLLSGAAFVLSSLWPGDGLMLLIELVIGGAMITVGLIALGELRPGEISWLRHTIRHPLLGKNP